MRVHYDREGHKIWVGQDVEHTLITVRVLSDEFHAWDTGNFYKVLDESVGWEVVMRGLPIPVETLPKNLVPADQSF